MFSDEHQFDQVHPSPADADQKPVKDARVALFCFFCAELPEMLESFKNLTMCFWKPSVWLCNHQQERSSCVNHNISRGNEQKQQVFWASSYMFCMHVDMLNKEMWSSLPHIKA